MPSPIPPIAATSPHSPADAVGLALPDDQRRPLQRGKALHAAQRSENDGGEPLLQRSEDARGVPIIQRTTAWPLALAFVCLIVYASLYPFSEWRNQDISPLRFITAPLPRYWTWFDVGINMAGYAPLGFLLALAALRSRRVGWAVSAAVTLLGLAVQLTLLNQAPADPYFAQTLQTWEQGQFIRFHGVVQWLGWLWPYAALLYVLMRLSGRDTGPTPELTVKRKIRP